jgi:hypothetical protein
VEIASCLGILTQNPLNDTSVALAPERRRQHSKKKCGAMQPARSKSKDRRRPQISHVRSKPDTAFMLYATLRQDLRIPSLSCVEFPKVVGERWSRLPADVRDI